MIARIGVIYQDANSLGFLKGVRDRLKCEAEFVSPPTGIGRTKFLPRKKAKEALLYFQKHGVDLIVRFTDADAEPWQDVHRQELRRFPADGRSHVLCGVAVNNPEEWLALDVDYLANVLDLPAEHLRNPQNRTGLIKRALRRFKRDDEQLSDAVARIVRDAPADVFRSWLRTDEALREFYSDCRAAATREECDTPNELDTPA